MKKYLTDNRTKKKKRSRKLDANQMCLEWITGRQERT